MFFFIDSLKYLFIVLSEIKDMPETAFNSAPFSLTLKEATLSEQGYSFKNLPQAIFTWKNLNIISLIFQHHISL